MKKLGTLVFLIGTAALTTAIVYKIKQTNDRKATISAPLPPLKSAGLITKGPTGLSVEQVHRYKAQLRGACEHLKPTLSVRFDQFIGPIPPQKADGMLETCREKGYTFRADNDIVTLSKITLADPQLLLDHLVEVAHLAHTHKIAHRGFDLVIAPEST